MLQTSFCVKHIISTICLLVTDFSLGGMTIFFINLIIQIPKIQFKTLNRNKAKFIVLTIFNGNLFSCHVKYYTCFLGLFVIHFLFLFVIKVPVAGRLPSHPYQCPKCNWTFLRPHDLISHICFPKYM